MAGKCFDSSSNTDKNISVGEILTRGFVVWNSARDWTSINGNHYFHFIADAEF